MNALPPAAPESECGRARRRPRPSATEKNLPDVLFRRTLYGFAAVAFALVAAILVFLTDMGLPALREGGLTQIFSMEWNPPLKLYGILPFIYGTIVSSLLALVISTPISISAALFLTEIAPRRVGSVFSFLVEMLAAIPSVVYGLWGIFVVAPWMRVTLQPWLREHLGFLPVFQGQIYGVSLMSASVILAIMITPTITAICREVFAAVPAVQREGVLSLGSTRFEMFWIAIIRSSRSGILGAMILGLARALGETMAVTMVIGNNPEISLSFFAPAQTMASAIASEVAEASGTHLSALGVVGLILLLISGFVFFVLRMMVRDRKRVRR